MKLVKIIAEDSPYYNLWAVLFPSQDTMIILNEKYPFDFYQDERVPMYEVISEDEERVKENLVDFITEYIS